jgi:hypothetical protein
MSCKFLIASMYDYIRNTCLWLLVLGCFIIIYLQCPRLTDFMNYLIHATPVYPSLCLQYFILLFTIATITAFILLLLLLFHYYYHYKTIAIDKPLRACLFPGAAELTTHLLRLINILWLPLCQIKKLGFTSLEDCSDPLYLWVITPHDAAPLVSMEWSTERDSSRPSSLWGFQTRAWGKLRKN